MNSIENVQQITDIQILKDKIIKIDTIFSLISEKQNKINSLEGRCKKFIRENGNLMTKNAELLRQVEKNQKVQDKIVNDYEGKILEERQYHAELKEKVKKIKSFNGRKTKIRRKQLETYKVKLMKMNRKYREAADKRYSYHIHKLRRIIKKLRARLKHSKSEEKENICTQNEDSIEGSKILTEMEEGALVNLSLETTKYDATESFDIDKLINEMVILPDLLTPFDVPEANVVVPKKMQNIQTQTMRSNVSRPVQTNSLAVSKSCKETQTKITNSIDSGVQCLFEVPSVKVSDQKQRSKTQHIETQTALYTQYKVMETQTTHLPQNDVSIQVSVPIITQFEGKITLKRAVEVLKRSRATFSISKGMLIHYSKQAASFSNESQIAKTVYRRLTKYVDQQFGNVRKARRRGFGNVLNETKQLERSRELMQLRLAFGLGNSDTESSGYESRIVYKPTRVDCPSVDSGMMSEADVVKGTDNDDDWDDLGDVGVILEEVIDVPTLLSPISADDDIENSDNEDKIVQKRMKLNDHRDETVLEKHIVVEDAKDKNKRKGVVKNRMALLRRGIKKCNQVKVTRMATSYDKNDVVEIGKKREAYKSIPKSEISVKGKDSQETEDNLVTEKLQNEEILNKIGCDVISNLISENVPGTLISIGYGERQGDGVTVKNALGNEEFQRIKKKVLESNKRRTASDNTSDKESTITHFGVTHKKAPNDKKQVNEITIRKTSIELDSAPDKSCNENPDDARMIESNDMTNEAETPQTTINSYILPPNITNTKSRLHANDILKSLKCIEEHSYCCKSSPKNVSQDSDNILTIASPPLVISKPPSPEPTPIPSTSHVLTTKFKSDATEIPQKSPLQQHKPNLSKSHVLRKILDKIKPQVTESNQMGSPLEIAMKNVFKEHCTIMNSLEEKYLGKKINNSEEDVKNELGIESSKVFKKPVTFKPIVKIEGEPGEQISNRKMLPVLKSDNVSREDDQDDVNSEGSNSDVSMESVQRTSYSPRYTEAKHAFDHLVRFKGHSKIYKDEVEVLQRMDNITLVNFVIQYLKADFSEVDPPANSLEPLLTIKQKVLIGIMLRFERETHQDLIILLVKYVEKYLLYNAQRTVDVLESMARFYTALCRLRQMKHRVRMFIADLLYIAPRNRFVIIYKILTSWFNVMLPYTETNNGVGIDRVLSYVALTRENSVDECVGVLKNLLITYYKYPKDPPSRDDLMKSLFESYMCGSQVQFEVGILILCMYNDPEWTYEKVQLIGELCNVSQDAEIIRNFVQLIGRMKKKLPIPYQQKLHQFGCELISRFEKVQGVTQLKHLYFKDR